MAQGVLPFKYEKEFKQALSQVAESEWKPMYKTAYGKKYKTGVKWAEVCYVSHAIARSKKGPEYGYPTKREVFDKQQLNQKQSVIRVIDQCRKGNCNASACSLRVG